MKDIHYDITFHSYWHCGSGQSAGADVDELTVKDRQGFPYVPGRTVKGLLRDAATMLVGYGRGNEEAVRRIFGHFDDKDNALQGEAFFSDATLSAAVRSHLMQAGEAVKQSLYASVTATAIDDAGIAQDKSLRKIEVVVPCTVKGVIENVGEEDATLLTEAMKMVKRLGLGRHHGLGRCTVNMEGN